jgi:hypothetical protein
MHCSASGSHGGLVGRPARALKLTLGVVLAGVVLDDGSIGAAAGAALAILFVGRRRNRLEARVAHVLPAGRAVGRASAAAVRVEAGLAVRVEQQTNLLAARRAQRLGLGKARFLLGAARAAAVRRQLTAGKSIVAEARRARGGRGLSGLNVKSLVESADVGVRDGRGRDLDFRSKLVEIEFLGICAVRYRNILFWH